MPSDPKTIAIYDDKAEDYAQILDAAGTDPELEKFVKRLPAGSAVLDLGCGPGNYANAMRAAGFAVTATDASATMVEMARQYAGIDVRQSFFEDLDETAAYDGIWANFSLLHAPKADFSGHMQRIAKALKPGGLFHIGMKTGEGEYRDSMGRFYSYYSANELRDSLQQVGLKADSETTGVGTGLSGDVSPWVTMLAVKI